MLEAARTRVRVLRECVYEAEAELRDLSRDLVLHALPDDIRKGAIETGSWECPTSPLQVCAYDVDNDPACDDCLFCHDPDERK